MKLIIPVMIPLFLSLGIHAQVIDVKGIGEVDAKDGDGKEIPLKQTIQAATHMACLKAVEEAISHEPAALRQQFGERVGDDEARKKTVAGLVTDRFIETMPRPKLSTPRMRVYLRGKLDMAALRDQLNLWPKIEEKALQADVVAAVFFTVRRTVAVRNGDAEERRENNKEKGKEKLDENGIETEEDIRERKERRIEKIFEEAKLEADPEFKAQWGTGLLGQFTEKGFKDMVDGALFDVSDALDADVTKRGSPAAKTLMKMMAEVRELDDSMTMVILGTLDFSQPTVDPVSGLWSVQGTASGKIWKVPSRGLPRTIAALSPVRHKALARSQQDAKGKALAEIAPLVADEIISKLVNKDKLNPGLGLAPPPHRREEER